MLARVIRGRFPYLIEYFAGNFALSDKLVGTIAGGSAIAGIDVAAGSSAPIGEMIVLIGNSMLGGLGFGLMIVRPDPVRHSVEADHPGDGLLSSLFSRIGRV